MNPQLELSEVLFQSTGRPTRRQEFCDRLERLVPWNSIMDEIGSLYHGNTVGRKAYPLEIMLRVHILQLCFNLSDRMMEESLSDSFAFRRFVGIGCSQSIPDETSILRFRHFLEAHGLGERIFAICNEGLRRKGLLMSKGTIVDATFVDAPSSTKNKEKKRDPEMRSGKKANTWHYGAKVHVGADKTTGIVHTVKVTPANVADITVARELLPDNHNEIVGDAGYQGMEKRSEWRDRAETTTFSVSARPGTLKKQSQVRKDMQRKLSSVRSRVEHVFFRMKCQFKFRKTPYKGLTKLENRVLVLLALGNLVAGDDYLRSNPPVVWG